MGNAAPVYQALCCDPRNGAGGERAQRFTADESSRVSGGGLPSYGERIFLYGKDVPRLGRDASPLEKPSSQLGEVVSRLFEPDPVQGEACPNSGEPFPAGQGQFSYKEGPLPM